MTPTWETERTDILRTLQHLLAVCTNQADTIDAMHQRLNLLEATLDIEEKARSAPAGAEPEVVFGLTYATVASALRAASLSGRAYMDHDTWVEVTRAVRNWNLQL